MPKIQAFRGLRYNLARVGSLSDVVAPPYDVIDGALQQRLYQASPYNFVRLELTKPEPGDEDPEAVYKRAASLYRQWIREGVLQHEPDPALYVYHQIFDYAGTTYTRRGFMCRVKLVRFGEGNIYPHEQTHAKAKDDRLRLTRACQANMSQIYGLYPDPENAAQNLLEAHIAGSAALEAVDHLGVTHRLWPVTDQQIISQVATLLDDKPMFVADGHHRYETACNYRDELAEAAGGVLPEDHPANYVLTMVMSMDDPGLIVLPTHRLFHGVEALDATQLRARLEPLLDCQPAGEVPEAAHQVWQQIEQLNDQGAFGLYTAKDRQWTLVTANAKTAEAMERLAQQQSEDWRSLGVAMLHRLIIDELLGMEGHPKPTYVHLVDEVVAGLKGELEGGHTYPLAALVMPATVDDIRRVSLHKERMPAKSTYFYPKLLSGLVVNPLDGN
ncbi:MAG: phosphatase [Pirellulaceae bacterium]|nr:MAG: phosphatase [Pirellulaceae bacterium]